MKSGIPLILFYLWSISTNGQTEFDKRVDSLFFNFPRNVNISEIALLFSEDTTFTDIRYSRGCSPGPCISAQFLNNPVLHYLTDSAYINFSFYTEKNLFTIRRIDMHFPENEIDDFMDQFNSLYYYLDEYGYSTNEQEDHDKYPGKHYIFYGNKAAFLSNFPRASLHYNFFAGKNGKPGQYIMHVDFTERHEP